MTVIRDFIPIDGFGLKTMKYNLDCKMKNNTSVLLRDLCGKETHYGKHRETWRINKNL